MCHIVNDLCHTLFSARSSTVMSEGSRFALKLWWANCNLRFHSSKVHSASLTNDSYWKMVAYVVEAETPTFAWDPMLYRYFELLILTHRHRTRVWRPQSPVQHAGGVVGYSPPIWTVHKCFLLISQWVNQFRTQRGGRHLASANTKQPFHT